MWWAPLDDNDEAELGRALPKELKDPARGEELKEEEEENGWGSMVRVTGFGLKVTLREAFGRAVSGLALSCLNRGARSEVELAGVVGVVGLPGCCGDEAIVRSKKHQVSRKDKKGQPRTANTTCNRRGAQRCSVKLYRLLG